MKDLSRFFPSSRWIALTILSAALLSGCSRSKQDQAIDQAKKQAVATGQAQQVVSTDKDGNTVTTVVQPPQPGQSGQQVTTTVTPATSNAAPATQAANQPAPAAPMVNGQPNTAPAAAPNDVAVTPANVQIPAGTDLSIRINQHISVKSSRVGERFDGELTEPVVDGNGQMIVPKGAPVGGVVAASHRRGHFKGASILQLRLTSMTLNGTRYPLETRSLTRTKKGKGKRSAGFIGGGSGLGMLIGGVATGGVGLLVGGLAGAGAGTAAAGLTGNRDIDIPAESIVHFKLADALVLQPAS